MTPTTTIHSRALLVWLTISGWSARRYDKQVTNKVNAQYAASTDAGRYNKHLLPGDAPAYKTLSALLSSIRAQHYTHTLAWSDEGWRLLPTANYMTYQQWYRDTRRALDTAVDAFVADYPSMRAQAARLLNGLYKDEDYPTTDDLRSRFRLDVQYAPLPAAGDIRVDLANDQIATIESTIQSRVHAATQLAVTDAWTRLHDVVAHMAERLGDPSAVFRDTLVTNAREICDSLRRLNVTGDPELEQMRVRVERELAMRDPDHLRHDDTLRAQTATKATAILDAMKGVYV